MFRVMWNAVARRLSRHGNDKVSRLGWRMRFAKMGTRTVSVVRICRPCRHLSVDGYKFDDWSSQKFPVWNVIRSNRFGFSRVRYVGDCTYFRIPIPNWFAKWLAPIVTENNTRDGWWFGNERTENWSRYRGVRQDEERIRAKLA